jgi:hypothetical protein
MRVSTTIQVSRRALAAEFGAVLLWQSPRSAESVPCWINAQSGASPFGGSAVDAD